MIFADTGAFLAFYRKRDQYYREAARLWPAVQPVVTSNHVIDELVTRLGRLVDFTFAADCIEEVYASPAVKVISATPEDEQEAIRWMRKFADKRISFTDCVSFALMRRHRIGTAFTFDRRFRDAGFRVVGLP